MNHLTRWSAGLLLGTAVAGSAFAGAREDLEAFTRNLKGLDGHFVQTVYDRQGQLKETSSGTVALKAPRLFRWEYVEPYPQLIVADGEKVWIYDPDLEQVTVRPQGVEEQSSPLAALVDPDKLDRMFVVEEAGARDGLEWLSLTPKQEGQGSFRNAKLGFDGSALVSMQVVDALGQRTEIRFDQWTRNPTFEAGTFSYTPPEGVDVIGGG